MHAPDMPADNKMACRQAFAGSPHMQSSLLWHPMHTSVLQNHVKLCALKGLNSYILCTGVSSDQRLCRMMCLKVYKHLASLEQKLFGTYMQGLAAQHG